MTDAHAQRRKMLEAPVAGLVSRLAAPTVASMLVTNLYNAGDAWFVSRIGTSASGAVGIVFALMAVFQAFGFLFGHGAGSNISRRLGAGDVDGARVYASTSFFCALAAGAAVSAFGAAFLEPLARAFGSTDTILPYAKQYMRWILVSGPFFTASCVMNNILRYEGRAALAMAGLLSGSAINLALDPILMFGLKLGVEGAGIATAVAQTASFAILLSMFRNGRTASVFRPRLVSLRRTVAGSILAIGSPSLLRNACSAVAPVLLNHPTVCTNMLFQVLGLSGRAALLSTMRSGLFFFPLILSLPRLWGVAGVELAQPIADIASFAVSMPFLAHWYRKSKTRNAPSGAA